VSQGLYLAQRMALSQVLAPQLQQSLALLQAPVLELKALVEQELQQNPVLEEVPAVELQPPGNDGVPGEDGMPAGADGEAQPAESADEPAYDKNGDGTGDDFQAEFERLSQLDQEWRDAGEGGGMPLRQSAEEDEKRRYMFESLASSTSLQERLLQQLRLSEWPASEYAVAEAVIGNIDEKGYLRASVDELAVSTNISADRIQAVLGVVQGFDPPGVGARNLRECLMLQLERAGRRDTLEYALVDQHLEALGRRRLPEIARAMGCPVSAVQAAAERIARLEPFPGREMLDEVQHYVIPEVFVEKVGDEYVVTANDHYLPHLRISNTYKDLMAQTESSAEVRGYIRERIRAGKFLIKSLHQRQQTILGIAREIVKRQRGFFEQGVGHLKPLTMLAVAEAVRVHETTVSRAVSGKYMQTPRGVFEMKYFFTSGIPMSDGAIVSNASVKDAVADLVRKEDPSSPLSDDQIVKCLSEKGIKIARRTIAKYRTELDILPSHLRKVF